MLPPTLSYQDLHSNLDDTALNALLISDLQIHNMPPTTFLLLMHLLVTICDHSPGLDPQYSEVVPAMRLINNENNGVKLALLKAIEESDFGPVRRLDVLQKPDVSALANTLHKLHFDSEVLDEGREQA